jgi:uncharacterized membrane protein
MATQVSPEPRGPEIPLHVVPGVPPEPAKRARVRVDSIDLLRGIVMVIMLLDHTRDFVHYIQLQGFDPTDLTHSSVKIFFTRWITHFCAPIFVFLAGTGAYMQLTRGKSKSELSRFLLTRGFWLIVLEFTLVRWGAFLNFDYRFFGAAQVIWVIGFSMIVLAGLIHLPLRVIAGFGIVMIAFHNLLDRFHPTGWRGPGSPVPGFGTKIWFVLHQGFEFFPLLGWPSPVILIIYPLIPWIGVMAAGYALGRLYEFEAPRRQRLLLRMGTIAVIMFFVLRAANLYGDPSRWKSQATLPFTILSFFNVTKYPPSLLFLLMTLGPALLALALFERIDLRVDRGGPRGVIVGLLNAFITFGRVPLFFYLLQWPMAHLTSLVAHLIAGKPVGWMFASQVDGGGPPPGSGFNLAIVYVCWIAGVLLLYPLCKWYAGVKQRRRDWWLSYL